MAPAPESESASSTMIRVSKAPFALRLLSGSETASMENAVRAPLFSRMYSSSASLSMEAESVGTAPSFRAAKTAALERGWLRVWMRMKSPLPTPRSAKPAAKPLISLWNSWYVQLPPVHSTAAWSPRPSSTWRSTTSNVMFILGG